MPIVGKLRQACLDEFGEEPDTVIPRLIEEKGSVGGAAMRLGVFPNAIIHWLKSNKKHVVTEVKVLDMEPEHA